jgi:hypothetical protein
MDIVGFALGVLAAAIFLGLAYWIYKQFKRDK